MCTRVALAQTNTASSLVVIDDGEAVNLDPREAIILLGAKRYKIKVPFIDMELIQMYVADNADPNDHYVDLSNFNNLVETAKTWHPERGRGGGNGKKATKPTVFTESSNVINMESAKVSEEIKSALSDRQNKKRKGVIE
jgi:hypothetical protein